MYHGLIGQKFCTFATATKWSGFPYSRTFFQFPSPLYLFQSQRILIKTPKSKEIEPSSVFSVNDAFTSPLHRCNIERRFP